jgi:hypothetical protein
MFTIILEHLMFGLEYMISFVGLNKIMSIKWKEMKYYQNEIQMQRLFVEQGEYYHELLNKQGYMLITKPDAIFLARFIHSTIYGVAISPAMFFTPEQIISYNLNNKQKKIGKEKDIDSNES